MRAKEIAEKVAEKKAGDDYETPHPESITSLCYSCQKYKDCNVKTGTCQKCDQYINKAEAEKTDEQRYSESLKMLEFKDGKHTGRTIGADIIYMLEDYTGLTEGYCILGIRVTDYTGKVSETDTESGAVNV